MFDRDTGKAIADVVTLHDEVIDDSQPYEIFDPEHIWKRKMVTNFRAVKLRKKIFEHGQCIAEERTLEEIKPLLCRTGGHPLGGSPPALKTRINIMLTYLRRSGTLKTA